jgi:hypothetical protein
MSTASRLILLILPWFVVSCSGFKPQPLLSKVLTFTAADFGPEAMSAPLLGPGSADRQVLVVHQKQSHLPPAAVQVPVTQGIRHLNRSIKSLPQDAGHSVLRQRLVHTRSLMLDFYNTRRIAFQSVPPYTGRGAMARQLMLPGIGTTR